LIIKPQYEKKAEKIKGDATVGEKIGANR